MKPDPGLVIERLARAVLDGGAIDWDAELAAASGPHRGRVRRLRAIATIGFVHRTCLDGGLETPAAGDIWGPLRLIEPIARGSFGDVWRAWDMRLDRAVALKLLPDRSAPDAAEASVVDEGRLLARVRHPNVVTVYGADRIGGRIGIWMELIQGQTLEASVREHGPFDPPAATGIILQVANGLAAVHREGLLHRDVKARNVMRDEAGRVVLMDLGAAHSERDAPAEMMVGTPLYAAPEVLEGAIATCRSDVYSLAVLLYFLLTADYPVRAASVAAVREAHRGNCRTDVRDRRPDLPAPIGAVLERALASDPIARFDSVDAFAAALLEASQPGERRRFRSRRMRVAAAAAALLAILAVVGGLGRHPSDRNLPHQSRPWVLVAAYENRTGDAVLNGTIEHVFERELRNSSVVQVVSQDRVADTLRLMGKPPATRVDTSIGREVSVRDGGIAALIAGNVKRIGTRYVLTTEVLNPATGGVLATFSDEADHEQALLAAMRREALSVRDLLGESNESTRAGREQLDRVTTPSLRALQLYSQAAALMQGPGPWPHQTAEQFLQQAIAEDPRFASAHILRAWVLKGMQSNVSEYLREARAAVAMSNSVTDVERSFINASAHSLEARATTNPVERRRHFMESVGGYEAVLRLQQDHPWALTNARADYEALQRLDDEARMVSRLASMRPNNFRLNAAAAETLMRYGQPPLAAPYAARASQLLANGNTQGPGWLVAWIRLWPAQDAWLRGDVQGARTALDEVAAALPTVSDPAFTDLAGQLSSWYATLGQAARAEQVASRIRDTTFRELAVTEALWQQGERTRLRAYLTMLHDEVAKSQALPLMIDAGLTRESRAVAGDMRRRATSADDILFVDHRLAFAAHDYRRAAALGEQWLATKAAPYNVRGMTTAMKVADAFDSLGQRSRAISLLELYGAHRVEAAATASGYAWILLRLQLAEHDREAGRERDARAIEDDLMELLQVADADYPQLLELKRRVAARR